MTTSTNSLSPEIIAQLAELQALRAEKAAAEAEAKAAEERKRIAAENGGFIPGTHPFGFACLIDTNGDSTSPYVKFRVTAPTVVLREPQESADGKTVWGPELLVLPPGIVLSWSAGGPKSPLSTGAYLSASGGSSSSKIGYDPKDWMTCSQIGTLVRYVHNGSAMTGTDWYIDGAKYRDHVVDGITHSAKAVWLTDVDVLMNEWLETLTPVTTGKRKTRR